MSPLSSCPMPFLSLLRETAHRCGMAMVGYEWSSLPLFLCLHHNGVGFSRGAGKNRRGGGEVSHGGTVGCGVCSGLVTDLKQGRKGKPWDLQPSLGRNLAAQPLLKACRQEKATHWPGAQVENPFLALADS